MAGFSGDGDARILASMRYNSNLNAAVNENEWFGTIDSTICFLQDVVHVGTKLRNRLLDSVIFLSIGTKMASVAHLKMLINCVPKAVHGLVYSDICPDDRQNYGSLEKIMQPRVREALATHILSSEGTIEYIRICQEITSSLYDDDLSPLERLSRIWRSTFFIRAWRLYTKRSVNLDFDNNFLSRNAYQCIELNAKNLVILIKKFRDEGLTKYFHPSIFNSQPCEETFRKLRSMGTINFTKVNFTLLELVHLINRLELMDEIVNFKLAAVDVHFPRKPITKSKVNNFILPSDEEIENTLQQALKIALLDAEKFGMHLFARDIQKCGIKQVEVSFKIDNQQSENAHVDLGIGSSNSNDEFLVGDYLKDYSNRKTRKSNSYMTVAGKDSAKKARKTTVVWSASSEKMKLSADRLRRVQTKKKSSRRQIEFVSVSPDEQFVKRNAEIKIGDWCIFRGQNDDDDDSEFIYGNILAFRYMNVKTKSDKKFSWDFCTVSHEENSRGVEVLAAWNRVDESGQLHQLTCSFMNIERYVSNISCELIEKNIDGNIYLSQKHAGSVNIFLKKWSK